MNANTACKIREAVEQAIRCGEERWAVLAQVETVLERAEAEKAAREELLRIAGFVTRRALDSMNYDPTRGA